MEQKKRSLLQRFQAMRWSHKTILVLGLLIFCSNLFVLLLVCQAATSSLREEAYEHLQEQLTVALSTVENATGDITDLMITLSTADLAEYAWADKDERDDLQTLNRTNAALRLLVRANSMVDYAALIRPDSPIYLYSGTLIPDNAIRQIFLDSYADAAMLSRSSVSSGLLLDCYPDPELNFYCPIYGQFPNTADEPCALLVVGLNTRRMHDAIAAKGELNLRILSADGIVLASGDRAEVGTAAERFADYRNGGQMTLGDSLLACRWAEPGDWIADGAVSQRVLFANVRRTALLISGVVILFTLLAIIMSAAFCNWFYAPISEIVAAMERVKDGHMDTRMRSYREEDFQQLSEGLNSMLQAIEQSIDAIQRQ